MYPLKKKGKLFIFLAALTKFLQATPLRNNYHKGTVDDIKEYLEDHGT